MRKTSPWILLILVVLASASLAWRSTAAQTGGQVYFPETGHWVTGEFLDKYQSAKDPGIVYGYPITDAYQDQITGQFVQYFERARFELHPEAPAELRVQLTPLGQYLYTPQTTLQIPENFPACKLFAETGYQVCYAFLEFFNANGGAAQFGYPISNFEHHDDRIVQYFQRARFEWRPERPSGQRVVLSNLGSQYFNVRGENPIRLLANVEDSVLQTILSLRVRAFPQSAVMGKEGSQTVYVIVQDQNLRPVANAQVVLIVRPPSGVEGRYILPMTNEHGFTKFTFPYQAGENGVAKIMVSGSYDTLAADTVTSFRVWW